MLLETRSSEVKCLGLESIFETLRKIAFQVYPRNQSLETTRNETVRKQTALVSPVAIKSWLDKVKLDGSMHGPMRRCMQSFS